MRMLAFIRVALLMLPVAPTVAGPRAGEDLLAGPSDSRGPVSAEREAKDLRYNGGGCDITTLTDGQLCFFDQYEPRSLPLIPTRLSTIVAVGEVVNIQAFLSTDRTHIYNEITLTLDEVFKPQRGLSRPSDRQLVVDHMGGELHETSGRILRDNTRSGFMGRLRIGGRYLLFAQHIHRGRDLEILTAYELRDGKAYELAEDGAPAGEALLSRKPKTADALSSEQSLLQAVRQSVKENHLEDSRH